MTVLIGKYSKGVNNLNDSVYFVFRKKETLITFWDNTSVKFHEILSIPKEHNLSMSDAKVPKEITKFQKYRLFSALPQKH